MHGQLAATSVADICRELAGASATGVLHIAGPEAAGRLVFDQGRLVAASSPTPGSRLGDRLVNGGLLDEAALERILEEQRETPEAERSRLGQLLVDRELVPLHAVRLVVQEQLLDAVFDLTGWPGGTYRFEPDAEPDAPEVPLAVPVDQALVEVARRREEWAALTEVITDLDAVPRFREGASTASADLEPDEFAVMASVDGVRSVRDLAYDLGYGEFEAARVVYGLCLLGLVEVEAPVDEIGAALDDALAYVSGQPEPSSPTTTGDASSPDPTGDAPPPPEPTGHAAPPPEPTGAPPARPTGAAPPPEAELDEPRPWSSLDQSWDDVLESPGQGTPPADEPRADEPVTDEPVTDEPVAGTDPVTGATEETLEAELPDLSAFEELRRSHRDEPPRPDPTNDEPAPVDPTPDEVTRPDPTADEDARRDPAPPSPPHPAITSDGDVSEFLRELSRLALDDDPDESGKPAAGDPAPQPRATRPPPRPRPAPEAREEQRRKKRGLFGFGG